MSITLDQNLSKKLEDGMHSGDTIELPFPVFYAWSLNGQTGYKSQAKSAPALYYGGWAAKSEDVQAVAEQGGMQPPTGWVQAVIDTREGRELSIYAARSVVVAPVGKRESWLLPDNRRTPKYTEGARRHVQALAYMAEKQGANGSAKFIPWGPVVLTAKGYQAKNLLNAFTAWEKASSGIRFKIAPGVPAWCFFLALGTFGTERVAENVGKTGAQSPITPITAYIPEKLSDETMESLFVGEDLAGVMAELQDQAREWLDAWKEPVEAAPAQGENDDFFVGGPTPSDDEIPF